MYALFKEALRTDAQYFLWLRSPEEVNRDALMNICKGLSEQKEEIFLGIPEKITVSMPEKVFGFLSGIDAKYLRANLIGMDREFIQAFLKEKGKEKAFFTNLILEARANGIEFNCVAQGDGETKDKEGWKLLSQTSKLYLVFIKFSISAAIAYIVDIGSFYLFQVLFAALADEFKILIATILSRILCSVATYLLNKGAVFKSQAKATGAVVRFVILATAQLVASWLLVWGLGTLFGGGDLVHTVLKVVVDLVIFMASFTIQRDWVFKKTDGLLG